MRFSKPTKRLPAITTSICLIKYQLDCKTIKVVKVFKESVSVGSVRVVSCCYC